MPGWQAGFNIEKCSGDVKHISYWSDEYVNGFRWSWWQYRPIIVAAATLATWNNSKWNSLHPDHRRWKRSSQLQVHERLPNPIWWLPQKSVLLLIQNWGELWWAGGHLAGAVLEVCSQAGLNGLPRRQNEHRNRQRQLRSKQKLNHREQEERLLGIGFVWWGGIFGLYD